MLFKIGLFNKLKLNYNSIKDVFNLGIIRLLNNLSKYILISYLIRTLGEYNYGVYVWLDSITQYSVLLIGFGFELYAAKYIVEYKEDQQKINEIISSVLIIKSILFLLSYILLIPVIFTTELIKYKELILILFLMGLGEIFLFQWYFQGIQKLTKYMLINLFSRASLILLTIVFVRQNNDLTIYIVLIVLTYILNGILNFALLKKESRFVFQKINPKKIIEYAKEGFAFFIGKFSMLLYNLGLVIFIGVIFSKYLVAGYDICLKIIFMLIIPFEIIQYVAYPKIIKNKNKLETQKLVLFTFLTSSLLAVLLYLFSGTILNLIGGEPMLKYSYLLERFVILIPAISTQMIIGSCCLIAYGYSKMYNLTYVFYLIFVLIIYLFLTLTNRFTFENLTYSVVIIELCFLCLRFFFSKKYQIL